MGRIQKYSFIPSISSIISKILAKEIGVISNTLYGRGGFKFKNNEDACDRVDIQGIHF